VPIVSSVRGDLGDPHICTVPVVFRSVMASQLAQPQSGDGAPQSTSPSPGVRLIAGALAAVTIGIAIGLLLGATLKDHASGSTQETGLVTAITTERVAAVVPSPPTKASLPALISKPAQQTGATANPSRGGETSQRTELKIASTSVTTPSHVTPTRSKSSEGPVQQESGGGT
jgi:hypothetical protein